MSTLTFCAFVPPVRKCKNVRDPMTHRRSRLLATEQPWPHEVHFTTKCRALGLPQKAHDVNDLRQHLFDVRVGVSITDDGIDQWPAFEPQEDNLNIHMT